jgi:ArsR family transcriptional regulator, cadmium/lead-responsive transcriptional repressor
VVRRDATAPRRERRLAIVQLALYRCRVPIAVAPDLDVLARIGTALADDSRRRLLVTLMDGPAYPSDLADDLGLTRANVSNHLTCLRGCGIVMARPEGRRVRYQLTDPRLGKLLRSLLELRFVVDPNVCHNAVHDGCC